MRFPYRPYIQITAFMVALYCPLLWSDTTLKGLSGDAEKNVELMLALTKEDCKAPEWRVRTLFANADQDIDKALRAVGYYHARVKTRSLTIDGDCWHARFDIDLGERVVIKDVIINVTGEASDDAEFAKIKQKALQQIGQPLNHGVYEKLKKRIESLALSRGYLRGVLTEKRLEVNPKKNSAVIKLSFASQQRARFGLVNIQQSILRPDLAQRFVPIKPGDYYSSEALSKTYQAFSQSGYFSGIDIKPDTDTTNPTIPVNITLLTRKRHHYQFGAGYDTDIGPLLSAGYKNRRLNKRGHFLTADMNLSPVLSTAEIEYNIPLANPVTDFFSIGAGIKREDTNAFQSMSGTLSARINRAFRNGWKETWFLDYSYEDFTTDNTRRQTLLLVPGASWQRAVADNLARPNKAYRIKLDISGSYRTPISQVSFLQAVVSGLWIHDLPLSGKFLGRAEFGGMLVEDFDRLPTSYRFYAGGINSIRGFSYKELGPKDRLGHVEGGQFLAVLSAEYEQEILDNWSIAGFIDGGNAFNTDRINIKAGAGLGVRWYSPFGPIRVDLATPVDNAGNAFQIHFSAGTRL